MCCVVLRLLFLIFGGACVVDLIKFSAITPVPCTMQCKNPQPRAIRITELVNVSFSFRTAPYMTIVHRCDEGSGCCSTIDTICKPAKIDPVEITIAVQRHKKRYKTERHLIKNHTECSCQRVYDDPK